MAIKASGNLSMLNDIVAEFGGSEPHKISDYYSEGTLPTTGYITFSDFYGQASGVTINITISSNTNNYNLWNSKGGTYSAGNTTVNVTINSGVAVGSTSTGTYAFDTGTGWSSGDVINITNNGTIKGRGGDGAAGGNVVYNSSVSNGGNGGTGGNAFRAQFACTVTNNGSVYGGGGGGGGGGSYYGTFTVLKTTTNGAGGGGGGGGGAGVNAGSGGSGGSASGGVPTAGLPGNNGTATAGGAGGGTGGGVGGTGGGLGANGVAGTAWVDAFTAPKDFSNPGTGGTRGFYEVGRTFINSSSGIGGTVGGRSS